MAEFKREIALEILDLLNRIEERPDMRISEKERAVLDSVTVLNLDKCNLTRVPDTIGELRNLTELSLHDNSISSLPVSIGQLQKLTTFDCSFNQLTQLPVSIGQLQNLTTLSCSSNWLTQLPDSIANLHNLNILNIAGIGLQSLPEWITKLQRLHTLFLESNQLTKLPENFASLSELEFLTLNNNKFQSIPSCIGQLKKIETLFLDDNPLTSLPDFLGDMPNLKYLILEDLELDSIPKSLLKLDLPFTEESWGSADRGICIRGLKLRNQPLDMFLQNDRALIEDWYRNHQTGQTLTVNEAKVVFLGDGDVGKTYTIKRLIHDGEKEDEQNADYFKTTMTHGIIIEKKQEKLSDGRDVLLRYWDFGGQTIMHSMHRCFLTENTCYVVMINTRNDRDQMTQARYWLRNVDSFAKNAPVILLINQWGTMSDGIDRKRLMEEFPILNDIIMLNAKEADPEEILNFRDRILKEAQAMKGFGEEWPISWNNVRNEITRLAEEKKEFFIPQDTYQRICADYDVDGAELQAALLERFNWLGICFSYHRDQQKQILAQYKVLNPEWLTNAIYLLIMNGQAHAVKAILPFGGVKSILKHPEDGESGKVDFLQGVTYEDEACHYVLEIMRKFGLSYETPDGEFVPVLCTEDRPQNLLPAGWDQSTPNKDHVTYILRYQYKPDTIIQRLMVYCKKNDIPVEVWKNGMRVSYSEFGLTILVDAGKNEEDIIFDVYSTENVKGYKADTYLLLQLILSQMDLINQELGMEPKALVEVSGEAGKDQFTLEKLLKYAKKGRTTIDGNGAEDDEYEVMPLLESIYGKQAIRQALKLSDYGSQDKKQTLTPAMVEQFAKDAGMLLIQDPYTEEGFCTNIRSSLQKIQANHKLWGRLEDDYNTALRDLLPDVYEKRDQTRSGISSGNKNAGELDLELRDKTSCPLAIVEALKLKGLDADNYSEHLDKALVNYNPNGLPYSYIVIYCEAAGFDAFWDKIVTYMKNYSFPEPLKVISDNGAVITEVPEVYTELRHAKMTLMRNKKRFPIHIYAITVRD